MVRMVQSLADRTFQLWSAGGGPAAGPAGLRGAAARELGSAACQLVGYFPAAFQAPGHTQLRGTISLRCLREWMRTKMFEEGIRKDITQRKTPFRIPLKKMSIYWQKSISRK